MKSMNKKQVGEFLTFLRGRIEWHIGKMANSLSDHRVLIKTERAEVEVILNTFLKILNDRKSQ